MAAISTEPKGIHKIPNEILVNILALVPFVPPSPSCPNKPDSLGSHDRLKQVDHRFRDVVDSAALRLQTARRQFPEQAALRGLITVSATELVDISLLDSNIRLATDKVLKKEARESTQRAIFTSLHLLSYMSSLVDDERRDLTNACLFVWAKKDLFHSRWLQVLRHALHRMFDHFFPTIEDFANMLPNDPMSIMTHSLVIQLLYQYDIRPSPEWAGMLRRRCFESAILLQNHAGPVYAKILAEDLSDLVDNIGALHDRINSILVHRLVIAAGARPEVAEVEFKDDLDFVRYMQWRMLSEEREDEIVNAPTSRLSQISIPYVREASNDSSLHYKFEMCNAGDTPSISIREMKGAGSFLRKAFATISKQGVPNHLERYAEARGLFSIMSMSDDNDETEDDEDVDSADEDNGSDDEDEAESDVDEDDDGMDEDGEV